MRDGKRETGNGRLVLQALSPKPQASSLWRDIEAQKNRVRRIVSVLEEQFGVPEWAGPTDPLASLIRTMLSQNTNDLNSGEAYRRLTERYPTLEAVMEADPREVADVIRVGGLANGFGISMAGST